VAAGCCAVHRAHRRQGRIARADGQASGRQLGDAHSVEAQQRAGFAPLDDLVGEHLMEIGHVVHASILNHDVAVLADEDQPPLTRARTS
jgi:hypothetical protein